MARWLEVTREQFNDVRAYLDEAPQAVKVFKRILSIIETSNLDRLKTSKNEIEIFRAQGALDIIKTTRKTLEDIKG